MIEYASGPFKNFSAVPKKIEQAAEENVILNTNDPNQIEAILALCHAARERLPPDASFRLRVLLDMTLLELGRELARLSGDRTE